MRDGWRVRSHSPHPSPIALCSTAWRVVCVNATPTLTRHTLRATRPGYSQLKTVATRQGVACPLGVIVPPPKHPLHDSLRRYSDDDGANLFPSVETYVTLNDQSGSCDMQNGGEPYYATDIVLGNLTPFGPIPGLTADVASDVAGLPNDGFVGSSILEHAQQLQPPLGAVAGVAHTVASSRSSPSSSPLPISTPPPGIGHSLGRRDGVARVLVLATVSTPGDCGSSAPERGRLASPPGPLLTSSPPAPATLPALEVPLLQLAAVGVTGGAAEAFDASPSCARRQQQRYEDAVDNARDGNDGVIEAEREMQANVLHAQTVELEIAHELAAWAEQVLTRDNGVCIELQEFTNRALSERCAVDQWPVGALEYVTLVLLAGSRNGHRTCAPLHMLVINLAFFPDAPLPAFIVGGATPTAREVYECLEAVRDAVPGWSLGGVLWHVNELSGEVRRGARILSAGQYVPSAMDSPLFVWADDRSQIYDVEDGGSLRPQFHVPAPASLEGTNANWFVAEYYLQQTPNAVRLNSELQAALSRMHVSTGFGTHDLLTCGGLKVGLEHYAMGDVAVGQRVLDAASGYLNAAHVLWRQNCDARIRSLEAEIARGGISSRTVQSMRGVAAVFRTVFKAMHSDLSTRHFDTAPAEVCLASALDPVLRVALTHTLDTHFKTMADPPEVRYARICIQFAVACRAIQNQIACACACCWRHRVPSRCVR